MRRFYCLTLFLTLPMFLSGPASARAASRAAATERRAVIFYTAETHGILEPCGCTSDPLGDFARVTALVRATAGRDHGAVLVDAGNLIYPAVAPSERQRPAADLRSAFIAREMARLPLGGCALGETDLARGAAGVMPKRLAINLASAPFVEPSRIVTVGGIRVGVLGIVGAEAAKAAGLAAKDPAATAQPEIARLREAGAELVILLAPVERQLARNLARTVGADFVVVGKDVGQGMARAERVGSAYLVAPAEELQRVGRLEIVLRGQTKPGTDAQLVDAGGREQARTRMAELDQRLKQSEADLARWKKDAGSDPAFLAAKSKERDELRAERARLGDGHWQAPASGSYFTNTLIPIRRDLPRDPTLATTMRQLDRAVGAANLRMAEPPTPAEPGRAFYVGDDKCTSCHKAAARFWKGTVHAQAWKTLVEVGKEAHDDCVSCHVTGYGEVGGSSLGFVKGLKDVQCEVCHGPGSIHVEKKGKETPFAGRTKTPESVCVRCHNEKHSDTFNYEAYLRDVLGPGHGEDARDKLGPGPTGKELRRAGELRARTAMRERRQP